MHLASISRLNKNFDYKAIDIFVIQRGAHEHASVLAYTVKAMHTLKFTIA